MNKNKILLLIGIFTVIVVGVALLLSTPDVHNYSQGSHPAIIDSRQEQNVTLGKLDSKVDTQGVVTVEVTPLNLSSNNSEWKFDVGINTHSLELNQDMTVVSTLVDDQGKEYSPVRWEGAPSGGHHREGVLTFKSIKPLPKKIELRIINIDAPVRSFVWNTIN